MANKVEYVKKYQERRDAIMLRPSKEDGQIVRSYAKAKGMSVQGLVMQVVLAYIENNPIVVEHRYGMRLRGYSIGAQPKGVLRREDDPTGKYHDIIVYERQLSADEVKAYELDEL